MIYRQIIKNRATPIWNGLGLGFQHILEYFKYLLYFLKYFALIFKYYKKYVSTFFCILDKLYLIVYTRNIESGIALINK